MLAGLQIALQGIREDAVVDACFRFMTGQVTGQNVAFAPSIPQLVIEARDRQGLMNCIEKAATRPPVIPRLPDPPISDEDRERMKPRIEALYKQFKVQTMPTEDEKVEYVSDPEREAKLAAVLDAKQLAASENQQAGGEI